jgi:peptide/nickel transport system substrate-binding protein
VLALVAVLAFAGPPVPPVSAQEPAGAVAGAAAGPVAGGILLLGNRGDPPGGWDPMRTSSIALHHVAGSVFGPGNLVKRCRANMYMVCPYLATSWAPSQDFTQWTFTIRQGVTWHDGQPFTPADVRFWFELAYFGASVDGRVRAPAYFRGNLGEIERVEALPGQVRVTLARPTVRFPEMLLDPRMKFAHPEHLMRPRIEAGDVGVSPLDVGLIGLGPFVVRRYDPGSQVQVRRFAHYWERDARGERLPYLAGIDFIVTPDPVAMDLAIRTGRLDGGARGEGHYLTAERQEVYERAMGADVQLARIGGGTLRLAFNVLRPGPWQDVRVRRAIALWIDTDAAVIAALGGQGYVSIEDWPGRRYDPNPFMLWPRPSRDRLERDRAEARRLMAEAGVAEGFAMGHLCRAQHVMRCEFLQDQLAGLQIDLQLHVVDEAEWNRARLGLAYDTQPGATFSGTVPEATEAVYGRYGPNPDAYAKHEDERLDDLYARLRAAAQGPQRVAIWRELERYLLLEQAYLIPIAFALQVVPYRSYVRGLVIPSEDGHTHTDFATVWLDAGAPQRTGRGTLDPAAPATAEAR